MIEIKFKGLDVTDFLDDVRGQALKVATVKATNRALDAAHREGGRIMERERNMERKKSDSKLSYPTYTKRKRVKFSNVRDEWACLKTSPKPISLLDYVEGAKTPESQKGKPVHRRRRLRIKISQASIEKSKDFIAKVQGNAHVFRLAPGKILEKVRAKEAAPGVHQVLSKQENQDRMTVKAVQSFERNFEKIFEREYQKLVDKHSDE